MWLHMMFHRVAEIPIISSVRPRLWLCACGKQWSPRIR